MNKRMFIMAVVAMGIVVTASLIRFDGPIYAIKPNKVILIPNSATWYAAPRLMSDVADSNAVYLVVPIVPVGDRFAAIRIDMTTGAQTKSNIVLNPLSPYRPFTKAPVRARVHGLRFQSPAVHFMTFPDGKGPGMHLVDSATGMIDIVLDKPGVSRPLLTRNAFNSSSTAEVLSLVSTDPSGQWIAALAYNPTGWTLNLFSARVPLGTAVSAPNSPPPTTAFTGLFTETSCDRNTNGLIDTLLIKADVTVAHTGCYNVVGILTGPGGAELAVMNELIQISACSNQVVFTFDGIELHDANTTGPYLLTARIDLPNHDGLSSHEKTYITQPYRPNQFEGAQVRLTGAYQDQKSDSDGNGVSDTFEIRVQMQVTLQGVYSVEGNLETKSGDVLAFMSKVETLPVGTHWIPLKTHDPIIYQNRKDGPYKLTALSVSQEGTRLAYIPSTAHILHP